MKNNKKLKLCVVGSGYVGLALSIELGKFFNTRCIDIDRNKIRYLKKSIDINNEYSEEEINKSNFLSFTSSFDDCKNYDVYFITVGTPIDTNNTPDLEAVKNATKSVGKIIKKGSVVVYESTVYPGLTEDLCVPLLSKSSGFTYKRDFFVAYSPERINPGDKNMTIDKIKKIISADCELSLKIIKPIYKKIIKAGVHVAENIKIAEAAKLIENTQRDLNIALINELSIIFNKMNIPTSSVIEAAASKWNFMKFRPGLVGGHCISVDPYYLTYKSETLGYVPTLIHAGRKINEFMPIHILNLIEKKQKGSSILILGFTFKENCKDIRNTKVFNLYCEAKRRGYNVDIYDPIADKKEINKEYKLKIKDTVDFDKYPIIIYAVNHNELNQMVESNRNSFKSSLFFDIPNAFKDKDIIDDMDYISL